MRPSGETNKIDMTATAEDLALLRDNAARFAAQTTALGLLDRHDYDDARRAAWLEALAQAGWTGLRASEDVGGASLSCLELCTVVEEFARKLLPVSAPLLATTGILEAGGVARGQLEDVLAGRIAILPGLQSAGLRPAPGHGSRLEPDGDGFRLSGSKHAIPDGASAQGFIVDAKLGADLALVYVPAGVDGLVVTSAATVDGHEAATLAFDALRLNAENVLARGAQAGLLLDRLRFAVQLGLAAECVGAAAEVFERTLVHLRTRRQFGRSLGAFQALQHRAVDGLVDIELARALVGEAARIADKGRPGTLELIAGARARAGDMALRIAKWAVQMHGAMGFTDECDVGLFLKRIMVLTRVFRTVQAHRQRFAEASWEAGAPDLFDLFRSDSPEDAAFRQEVRSFLDANLPAHLCDLPTRPKMADAMGWHRTLAERGWIAPSWPKEHGGMEATVEQRLILFEELAHRASPELSSQAINHIGPILIRFGTPEQKARFLPAMLCGDAIWCQGYSEPNSGSDLASLSTRARQEGDRFIINGQKIWTTGGHHADFMFALVRTDPEAVDRRQGISMILIDMRSKGIRRRPIRTITGEEEFAEVFFDDVEVPAGNIVLGINQGWTLANTVLEAERMMSSSPQKLIVFLDRVRRVARETGAWQDGAFRDRLAVAQIDALAFQAMFTAVLARVRAGERAGTQASILKIVNAELAQTLADLMLEASGSSGMEVAPLMAGDRKVSVGLAFLQTRRQTIYGGTSEIQRNILAKRVLDLGNEPKKR